MRIRRRPPLPPISSPLPPPPQIPDPSLFELQPPNKGEETKEKGAGGRGEGLHPVGDLPIEPHGWVMDPINWDPSPSASHPTTGRSEQASKPPFFPPTLSHAQVLKEVKEEEEEEMVDSNKRWNAQVNSNKRIGSSSSAVVSGERAPLPKKRRGGDGDDGSGCGRREEKPVGKEKTPKSKVRAKASSPVENDCTTVNGGENKRVDVVMVNGNVGSHGKKRRSPAVLMEGSRCSRVNGRGWRCCQQTLVGYSLCEHHLGKGRLRSMSGVRVQAGSSKPKKSTEGGADGAAPLLSSSPQEEEKAAFDVKQCSGVDHGGEDMKEEEEKQVKKRRKKIGMVKARTISSLLDETNRSVQLTLSPPSPPPPPPPPESAPMQSIDEGATVV